MGDSNPTQMGLLDPGSSCHDRPLNSWCFMFKSDTQFCSIKLLRVDEFFFVGGPAHHPVSIQADAWIRSAHQSAQSLVQSQSDRFERELQKQEKKCRSEWAEAISGQCFQRGGRREHPDSILSWFYGSVSPRQTWCRLYGESLNWKCPNGDHTFNYAAWFKVLTW